MFLNRQEFVQYKANIGCFVLIPLHVHVNSMIFSDSVVVCLWDMREVSACKLFYKIPPPEHKLTRQMSDRRMMSCIQTSHWNYANRRLRLCVWRKWISKKNLYLNENIKTFNVGSYFFSSSFDIDGSDIQNFEFPRQRSSVMAV